MKPKNNEERVRTWKVTPSNGFYQAPALYVEAKKEDEAVKLGKERTRLADFPNWSFRAHVV